MSPITAAGALAGFLITAYVGMRRAHLFAEVARCTTPTSHGRCGQPARTVQGRAICAACERDGRW